MWGLETLVKINEAHARTGNAYDAYRECNIRIGTHVMDVTPPSVRVVTGAPRLAVTAEEGTAAERQPAKAS